MVIKSIVTGSWFARTKLHLKEYFAFLQTGESHLPIDTQALKAAHKKLGVDSATYEGGYFDFVTAHFGDITVTYYEDGLMLLTKPVGDVTWDAATLREFYDKRLTPALALIYSVGTPSPMPSIEHQAKRPLFITVDAATDEEAAALAARFDEKIHHTARYLDASVFYGDDLIIIAVGKAFSVLKDKVLATLLLSREYEHKLRHFLDAHRLIWESLEEMRAKQKLAPSALPDIRSRLLAYQRELLVLRARLLQMAEYLPVRQKEIDDYGLAEALHTLKIYRFDKLQSATNYIDRLWTMLLDYLNSTTEITGFVYQENLQKEIEVQQFIFLLGAIASFIVLGTVAGSTIFLYNAGGQLLAKGSIVAFTLYDLARFGGGALIVMAIFFLLIKPIYQKVKMTSLLGSMNSQDRKPHD
jgi:hypothetical protein